MPITPMMSSPAPADIERQQRADAGGRKRGQDRDRVDEALVEHPEHDIHGGNRRREQEYLVRQRRLKACAAPWKLTAKLGGRSIS